MEVMIIISKDIKKEYSVTAGGQFVETTITPIGAITRATPDVHKFLNWVMREEVVNDKYLQTISIWWKMPSAYAFRGSFNMEQYNKVIAAKKKKTLTLWQRVKKGFKNV